MLSSDIIKAFENSRFEKTWDKQGPIKSGAYTGIAYDCELRHKFEKLKVILTVTRFDKDIDVSLFAWRNGTGIYAQRHYGTEPHVDFEALHHAAIVALKDFAATHGLANLFRPATLALKAKKTKSEMAHA